MVSFIHHWMVYFGFFARNLWDNFVNSGLVQHLVMITSPTAISSAELRLQHLASLNNFVVVKFVNEPKV